MLMVFRCERLDERFINKLAASEPSIERPVCKMTGKSGDLLSTIPADRRAELP